MYCRDIADTITTMGRTIIQWSSDFVKKLGLNVVYNDTDSVFFEIPNDDNLSNDELEKIGIDIGKKITIGYDDFVKEYGVMKKHTLVMDFEKYFPIYSFGIVICPEFPAAETFLNKTASASAISWLIEAKTLLLSSYLLFYL